MFQVFCQAMFKRVKASLGHRLRPHHPESARSLLISEAKQGSAWLVPGWETAWEYQVLWASFFRESLDICFRSSVKLCSRELRPTLVIAYGHITLKAPDLV